MITTKLRVGESGRLHRICALFRIPVNGIAGGDIEKGPMRCLASRLHHRTEPAAISRASLAALAEFRRLVSFSCWSCQAFKAALGDWHVRAASGQQNSGGNNEGAQHLPYAAAFWKSRWFLEVFLKIIFGTPPSRNGPSERHGAGARRRFNGLGHNGPATFFRQPLTESSVDVVFDASATA